MVRRHVREGAARVAQQRGLVAEMRGSGRSTELAETLLRLFEQVQDEHERHLARLEGYRPAYGGGPLARAGRSHDVPGTGRPAVGRGGGDQA